VQELCALEVYYLNTLSVEVVKMIPLHLLVSFPSLLYRALLNLIHLLIKILDPFLSIRISLLKVLCFACSLFFCFILISGRKQSGK
jgi:hypothetical protein